MKINQGLPKIGIISGILAVALTSPVTAEDMGYASGTGGSAVSNNYGECWRTDSSSAKPNTDCKMPAPAPEPPPPAPVKAAPPPAPTEKGYALTAGNVGVMNAYGECWRLGTSSPKPERICEEAKAAVDPDSDGDGVPDSRDHCPDTPAGAKVNAYGCHKVEDPDSDGDGVKDSMDKCPDTVQGVEVDANGCEIIDKIVIGDVHFAFDKATLASSARGILDDAVAKLRRNMQYIRQIFVSGHTDSTGPEAYNQGLSERRAGSVGAYLTEHGIDSDAVSSEGQGETSPVADNGTRDGRAQNRRVEIDVDMK